MSTNSNLTSSSVIAQSGIAFGTSGARGLVSQFTPDVCAAFSLAFITGMQRDFTFKQVAIAIDNRPSSFAMAMACATAIKKIGIEVIYYGVVPTPALAYVAQEDGIPAIMVTGSHIPFDRNGLKFYRPDGEISKADEQVINSEKVEFTKLAILLELTVNDRAAEDYIKRYTSLFDTTCLTGKRIGIYEHSSAGRDLYYQIFKKLGAEVISLERSDIFVPIDTEAVSEEDKLKAINWSKEHNLDAIFSTDGDGDRPLVTDEHGNWLRGDILGLLSADALNIEALVVPVSCNTGIEKSNKFKYVKRTKIGSPFVIAEFDTLKTKFNSVAGFEANGGFLLGSEVKLNGKILKELPTRDAVLPAILLLVTARNTSISSLINSLPQRFTHSNRIQNFAVDKSFQLLEYGLNNPEQFLQKFDLGDVNVISVDDTDGLRLTLSDSTIIHLRQSGNAPELRCYSESNTAEKSEWLINKILTKIVYF
ncbi:MAG: phosphomannomutase [Colwellia sp.]|jgi:phosphomannomutase